MAGSWYILYCNGKDWRDDPLYIGDEAEWTIHPEAKKGDFGLMYAKSPISAFVAIVKVLEDGAPTAGKPLYHANNEGWAEIEIIEEIMEPLEYREFSKDGSLGQIWPLVNNNMQPPKGPEKIPFSAIQQLAENCFEIDDILHNPDNEHRGGRRFIWRIMGLDMQPIEEAEVFDTEAEAKEYVDKHGSGYWVKRDMM